MKVLFYILVFFSCISARAQVKAWSAAEKALILRQLEETRQELLNTVSPLSTRQYFYRLDENSWSANDIIEHLVQMEEGYIREFWWALAQPPMPAYRDSTAGGDKIAMDYATSPVKSQARGTNLPLQRYCDKETGIRVFNTVRDQAIAFFTLNEARDMRGYFVFRNNAKGGREARDLHQQALWLISHTVRHTDQLKRYLADPRFPK